MKNKNALILFVRKPEPGKVKTRLAAQIGNEQALEIYKKLLQHTREVTETLNADKYLFGTETANDVCWNGFHNVKQQGEDLGIRMKNAFEMLFEKGYNKVVIIGSDCPSLTSGLIERSFNELNQNDVVMGPAEDGGYYLLGMKKLWNSFFLNKTWSTTTVFEETVRDFREMQLKYSLLPVLNDVDEEKDIPEDWLVKIK